MESFNTVSTKFQWQYVKCEKIFSTDLGCQISCDSYIDMASLSMYIYYY